MAQIADSTNGIYYSLTQGFSSFMMFVPNLVGALILLVIGWFIAGIVARLIHKALLMVGFERAVAHSGAHSFLGSSGIVSTGSPWTASMILAEMAKWFIRLIFVQAAANVLHMPQVTAIISSIILYIPNVIVATIVLVVGAMAARFLAQAVRGSMTGRGLGNPNLFATITQYAVLGFAVVVAVNQLGIAAVLVNTLFIGLVASLAIAVGLAFGLGGQGVAADLTRSWYNKSKSVTSVPLNLQSNLNEGEPVLPKKTGTFG